MTDEMLLATHARIQQAAFEAAYMDTPHPDPASHGFAALVFTYVERLWAEHRAGQGDKTGLGQIPSQKHVTMDPFAADGLVSPSAAEQRWERPH